MTNLRKAKIMLGLIVFGLLVSAITIWPAVPELKFVIKIIGDNTNRAGELYQFLSQALNGLEIINDTNPYMLYAHDWLAFAHIVLAILFAGAIRDPVRNIWIIQCGLIMCALVPVLAGICIPLRGLPCWWFLIDSSFAPAAAIPLWIALKAVKKIEALQAIKSD